MQKDVLLRSLPMSDVDWINQSRPPGMSQADFLRRLVRVARLREEDPQTSLFQPAVEPAKVYGQIPFTFIDLFAGIGGFRSGLTAAGGRCVYTSEWDKYAAMTYQAWYGDDVDTRDIRSLDFENDLPDHDVMAAGFPCQPFSLAGVSKKNSMGRAHGFNDEKQGNLFFAILAAIDAKRPPVVLLENVKNLRSHDNGNTWKVIHSSLRNRRYRVFHEIIDASGWVPQHRERIFIVAFDQDVFGDHDPIDFGFPTPPGEPPTFGSILESDPDPKYMLSDRLWTYLQEYSEKHRSQGNGFGFGIADPKRVSRTMSARYHKDGSEILIRQKGWQNPRRLTPYEASLLLGFDRRYAEIFGHRSRFPQVVSDTQAYRQFGNAVVPKVVEAIGHQISSVMAKAVTTTDAGCLLAGRSHAASA